MGSLHHQQQRRECEGVAADGPLQAAGRRAELPADRGQGDVDDRVAGQGEENARARHGEHHPPPVTHPAGPADLARPGNQPRARPLRRETADGAGPSSCPEAGGGPAADCGESRKTTGACGSPGSPDVPLDTGATGGRSNAVAFSLREDHVTRQVIRYLPAAQTFRPARRRRLPAPPAAGLPSAQEGRGFR